MQNLQNAKKAPTCNQGEPKQNDDRPSGQTQTQTLPLQPVIGWQPAASPTPPPESTSWLVFVISVFLGLFHLTSLVILIDSQLNLYLQTGSKGSKGSTTSSLHLPDQDLKMVASKKRKSLSADLVSQIIIAFQR